MNPIDIAKNRIFQHIIRSQAIPATSHWKFMALSDCLPPTENGKCQIVDEMTGIPFELSVPEKVEANWFYPTPDGVNDNMQPIRRREAVPVKQVLLGYGPVRTRQGDVRMRVALAKVTGVPQTTGVVTISVGAYGAFVTPNPQTGLYDVDPDLVAALNLKMHEQFTNLQPITIEVNQGEQAQEIDVKTLLNTEQPAEQTGETNNA
ncbi:MAG: hypothetical protein KatS3mg023_3848 [Armatimonadota bacterium]|nr:MAG: hypothetical protein KatS3mg023_2252 [Armatimonadota bacterium]GIV22097.1 MAG: hypothetical protein KatS3mg023_3848 [Armatimonadota bacterium]